MLFAPYLQYLYQQLGALNALLVRCYTSLYQHSLLFECYEHTLQNICDTLDWCSVHFLVNN